MVPLRAGAVAVRVGNLLNTGVGGSLVRRDGFGKGRPQPRRARCAPLELARQRDHGAMRQRRDSYGSQHQHQEQSVRGPVGAHSFLPRGVDVAPRLRSVRLERAAASCRRRISNSGAFPRVRGAALAPVVEFPRGASGSPPRPSRTWRGH